MRNRKTRKRDRGCRITMVKEEYGQREEDEKKDKGRGGRGGLEN